MQGFFAWLFFVFFYYQKEGDSLLKRVFLFCLITLLVVGPFIDVGVPIALANDEEVFDRPTDPQPEESYGSEWIPLSGIIMHDIPQRPGSHGAALALIDSKPPSHTGWSVQVSYCERVYWTEQTGTHEDGTPYYEERSEGKWIDYLSYSTNNQRDEGMLTNYVGQLNQKYGNLGIDWSSARGYLQGDWYESIYRRNSKDDFPPGGCQNGDYAFYYNDNDIWMSGAVQVDLPDPSDDFEAPGRNDGDTKGKVYWELQRNDVNASSAVFAYSDFEMTGEHYAVRNKKHMLTIGGQRIEQKDPISITIPDGMTLKGTSLNYGYSYDYTNYYRDIYKCVDSEAGYCYKWAFDERVPNWDYIETFEHEDSMMINHRMEDTVARPTIEEVFQESLLVGLEDVVASKNSKVTNPYFERWRKADSNDRKSMNNLKTQTTLPITPGALLYEVEVPSGGHMSSGYNVLRQEKTFGFYFPVDVDDSLKDAYSNETKYDGYDYAYPIQQATLTNLGSGRQEWDYGTDLFFMTKYTGFSVGTPYAAMLKANVANGVSIPAHSSLMSDGKEKIAGEFTNTTGQTFIDDVLYTDSADDLDRLQRYAIPISPTSPLEPDTTYANHLVLDNMGLNDAVFEFDQSFQFEHYLFGSGYDEAWIIEQSDARPVKIGQMNPIDVHTIIIEDEDKAALVEVAMSRPRDKMHRFRVTDRDLVEKIKRIVGDFGW